jgi:twitching motility protein PilU
MSKSGEQGMQTFDQALYKLYISGDISYESALASADSANDLRLLIKLAGDGRVIGSADQGLSLEASDEDTRRRR